jgi:hypothetical protein|tara:strand:+ start:107 stop:478 length:372 start_codon:yes stop_codon:yes gene_type:complete
MSTLQATGFHDAVEYKIVVATKITSGTDTQINVTGGPGRLFNIYLDGSAATGDYWLKVFDGNNPSPGSSVPQLILKGVQNSRNFYRIPYGFAFDQLSFWVTSAAGQTDTGNPSGSVTVKLVCS